MNRVMKYLAAVLMGVAMVCMVSCQTTVPEQAEEATEAPAVVAETPAVEEPAVVEEVVTPAPVAEVAEVAVPEPAIEGTPVELTVVDLSPTYDWSGDDFAKAYAPQIAEEKAAVEWQTGVKLNNGIINLRESVEKRDNVAIYARVILKADGDCKVHLSMGSDDGLSVFVNGEEVFQHNVMRGLTPNDEKIVVELGEGENELLFRVTQGGGDFGLQIAPTALGDAKVTQVIPAVD
jgi:hypothetical protein